MTNRLKNNVITGEYDKRERRVVRPDEILPSIGKTRLEQACFTEGAVWILRMLTTYRIDWEDRGEVSAEISIDTMQHVREEAGRRYPNFE